MNKCIISNNCWGGVIYESYSLPKLSPTVGMYFSPKDYLKFVADNSAENSVRIFEKLKNISAEQKETNEQSED